ncbi:hypothetical protein BBK36DRAFT_1156625 [Trichoderma citrinoviride]|uniref:Fumarate lyase N-terminal domain-containing protein n=1 Tax=Trichoderma citrinoviride TaxID=58853 RepID=A0A2T4BL94_9HYPO|nr:hypothetical protein BBK36DRAFT_1156625 [Trichoderma citrinoviride]PTB70077.1 hypothetical protein BBK36DRAFT_1156625 [Trichoderma citrinoviride]
MFEQLSFSLELLGGVKAGQWQVLYKQDVVGSTAFARPNAKAGIITQEEFEKLEQGLHEIEKEWEAGTFTIVSGADEDIFTANERQFDEIICINIAGKLHTGRSRNEHVSTGMPMNELSFEQLKATDSRFEEDIAEAFVFETSVEGWSAAESGTSKSSVLE